MKVIKSEYVMVTPAMAQAWLELVYFGQRPLDKKRCNDYAEMMRRGDWTLCHESIAIGMVRTSEYLIGGQHRLTAVVLSGKTILMRVEHIDYESLGEMKIGYANTNRGAPATMYQSLNALDTAEDLGVSKTIMRAASTSVTLIDNDFRSVQKNGELASPAFTNKVLVALRNSIKAYDNSTLGAYTGEAFWWRRSPVMAIGIVTFRFQPEKALAFWESVANNDGLAKHSPEAGLRRFISTSGSPKSDDYLTYSQRVARAWNAYYEGRSIEVLAAFAGTFIKISGTPYNGTQGKVGLSLMLGDK